MLLALLYHQVGNGKYANPLETFDAHFKWIASRFSSVLPGDPLPKTKLSVCLTFDDASFDFYHYIFPLLNKYRLKALLAVPTAYIPEKSNLSPINRLKEVINLKDKTSPIPSPAFCTWNELKELVKSPLIQIASHSLRHQPLTSIHINPENELVISKNLLEKKLNVPVRSFVYPFGIWNHKIHALAKNHYHYIFRIGNAHNISWTNTNRLLYRVNADQLPKITFPFKPTDRLIHSIRFLFNTFRRK